MATLLSRTFQVTTRVFEEGSKAPAVTSNTRVVTETWQPLPQYPNLRGCRVYVERSQVQDPSKEPVWERNPSQHPEEYIYVEEPEDSQIGIELLDAEGLHDFRAQFADGDDDWRFRTSESVVSELIECGKIPDGLTAVTEKGMDLDGRWVPHCIHATVSGRLFNLERALPLLQAREEVGSVEVLGTELASPGPYLSFWWLPTVEQFEAAGEDLPVFDTVFLESAMAKAISTENLDEEILQLEARLAQLRQQQKDQA